MITTVRIAAFAALAFTQFVATPCRAQNAASAATPIDPGIWGPYARLVGTTWNGPTGKAAWAWGAGNSIIETCDYCTPSTIRPGARKGELVSDAGALYTYDGTIASDGSVLWIRRGPFKQPMRVSIVDGHFQQEGVKLDSANQVTRVTKTHRFDQIAGPDIVRAAAPAVVVEPPVTSPGPAPAPAIITSGGSPATTAMRDPATVSPAPPASLPKLTVPPGVIAAEVGKRIKRPAGKAGLSIDTYALIGEAGAKFQAEAVGKGKYSVALYAPEGDEMLSVQGTGKANLTAYLPVDDVYVLTVARGDGAQPYTLDISAESPDLQQFSFREQVGYETITDTGYRSSTCWIEPGRTYRFNAGDHTTRTTLESSGVGSRVEANGNTRTFVQSIEGDLIRRVWSDGAIDEGKIFAPPSQRGAYRGYLCK